MKTVKEIINEINEAKICTPHAIDDVVDISGVEQVDTIDPIEHRWYITETVVYKIGDEFFGVRGPTRLKSESMSYSDTSATCGAFEMVKVPSFTFMPKGD